MPGEHRQRPERRLWTVILLCVVIQLMSPKPAHALFEWLDNLSGPGKFYGTRVDVRYWCSGKRSPSGDVKARLETAVRNTERIQTTGLAAAIAAQDWVTLASTIKSLNDRLAVLSKADMDLLALQVPTLTSFFQVQPAAARAPSVPEIQTLYNASAVVANLAQRYIDMQKPADVAVGFTGVFISLCSDEFGRRFALEDGSSVMATGGVPQYASEHWIWLITHTEALTYRVTTKQKWDVIDLGFQAGMYVFASKGFENFGGFLIEPFIDLRFPTGWAATKSNPWWSRISARVGAVNFPSGIDTLKFAASPDAEKRISPSEFTTTFAVYYRIR